MTVTINLVYILGLMLYSLVVTGFWVCSIIGAGKEAQDRILELQSMKDGCRSASSKAKALASENEKLRGEKRMLAEQYIKIQNEYGWFRQMVRVIDPGAVRSAEERIRRQKKMVPADFADRGLIAQIDADKRGETHRLKPVERPAKASDTGGQNG